MESGLERMKQADANNDAMAAETLQRTFEVDADEFRGMKRARTVFLVLTFVGLVVSGLGAYFLFRTSGNPAASG
jgi:hypothetical protein